MFHSKSNRHWHPERENKIWHLVRSVTTIHITSFQPNLSTERDHIPICRFGGYLNPIIIRLALLNQHRFLTVRTYTIRVKSQTNKRILPESTTVLKSRFKLVGIGSKFVCHDDCQIVKDRLTLAVMSVAWWSLCFCYLITSFSLVE